MNVLNIYTFINNRLFFLLDNKLFEAMGRIENRSIMADNIANKFACQR